MGDEGHVARAEDALFLAYPLLGFTTDDIDDFFARRVAVKRMIATRLHVGPHQHEVLVVDNIAPAKPLFERPR